MISPDDDALRPAASSPSRRPLLRFSLRMLFVLMAGVGLVAAIIGQRYRTVQQREQSVSLLDEYAGFVIYDYEHRDEEVPPGPAWARRWLGEHYFAEPSHICLAADESFDDQMLARLRQFPELRRLRLSRAAITDDGLVAIENLERLEMLTLTLADVSDRGMKSIGRMHRLEVLGLADTNVTDAGLRRLHQLKGLKKLYLSGTPTTAAGREAFVAAVPGCEVFFD